MAAAYLVQEDGASRVALGSEQGSVLLADPIPEPGRASPGSTGAAAAPTIPGAAAELDNTP